MNSMQLQEKSNGYLDRYGYIDIVTWDMDTERCTFIQVGICRYIVRETWGIVHLASWLAGGLADSKRNSSGSVNSQRSPCMD